MRDLQQERREILRMIARMSEKVQDYNRGKFKIEQQD